MNNRRVSYFLVFLKTLGWIFGSLLGLLLLLFILLQIPQVQRKIGSVSAAYFSKTLNTKVEIAKITIDFPKKIQIKEIYVEDNQQDTLWYSQNLKVDFDLFALLSNSIQINSFYLENATSHINRTLPDSAFNFDFIIAAFSSDKETLNEPENEETEWGFAVYNVELKDVYFTMNDRVLENNINANLGYFNMDIDNLDIENNLYSIDEIYLQNTQVSYESYGPATGVEEDTSTSQLPLVIVDNLKLFNIGIAYADIQSQQNLELFMDQFALNALNLDLAKQNVELDKILLSKADIAFSTFQPSTENTKNSNVKENKEMDWEAALNRLDFSEISFKYNNLAEPAQLNSIDYNNFLVSNLNLKVSDAFYMEDSLKADINQFSFIEKSGFEIKKFNTQLTFDKKGTKLEDLFLATGESLINSHFEIKYPSLEAIADNLGSLYVMANLNDSYIGFRDLFYFNPELAENQVIANNIEESISLNGKIEGFVSNVSINNFTVGYTSSTSLSINGNVRGLPDFEQAFFNLDKIEFNTVRNDLKGLVPDTLLPENITIPEIMAMDGSFQGTIYDFNSIINLSTSLGNVGADIVMKIDTLLNTENYSAHLSVVNLDAGKLFKQEELLGKLEMVAEVNGKGLTTEDIEADLKAIVKKVVVNNYEYNNLRIKGLMQQQKFIGNIELEDESLAFTFDGNVDFSQELPAVSADIVLKGADLQALNFSEEDIRLQGVLSADISGNNIDDLVGDIGVRNILIVKNGEPYRVDSMLFVSIKDKEQTTITLNSDFLSGRIEGVINPSDIGLVIKSYINRYFDLHFPDTAIVRDLKPQIFNFQLQINEALIITEVFVPNLQEFQSAEITGSFNSITSDFYLKLNAPHTVYENITLDSLLVNVNSGPEALTYSVFLSEISNQSLALQHPGLTGSITDDIISTRFYLTDSVNRVKFGMTALIRSLEDGFSIHLLPRQVIINYDQWDVPTDNRIRFSEEGFAINNLVLERNEQLLSINTKGNLPAETLEMVFKNFDIRTLSKIIEEDNERLYRGIIEGEVQLMGFQQEHIAFSSDLLISDFSYKADTVGNVEIQAETQQGDLFNIKASVRGQQNELDIHGTYAQKDQELNFILDIRNLALGTIESFVEESVSELSGSLRGNLLIEGTVDNPDIDGTLNFQKAGFNLVPLNAYFTLKDELLFFDEKGINFKSLTLKDTLGNTATVDGYILTEDYRDMFFNLEVTTDNFLALNTTEEDAEDMLYYGTLIVDSDLKITGNIDKPVIEARVNLQEGSDLTYIIPADEIAAIEREGIVEFINLDRDTLNGIMNKGEQNDTTLAEIQGIVLSANIMVDPETVIKIIVDQSTGDFIEAQGGGTMSFSMDPNGTMTLTGVYEIKEGNYRLSFYDLVKRDFTIKPGGSIIWTGDPLNAEIDITAIYTTRTSPLAFMETQMRELNEQQQQALNQPLPFEVYLNMTGDLLQPQIDFNIELPEDRKGVLDGTVNRRLQILNEQENELNKQVFALLVLNRFLPPDPFEPSNGGGLTATARSSASKILTQQLNQLASKHLKGVDLAFDVESYEDATELQVELEREFLDERLRVEIGGRVDVEGERRRRQGGSDIAGDVAVEYLLTPDGRYRLRAFRQNEFQMLIDGDVVETGLSLIFSRDFNKFRNLFRENNGNEKKEKKDESSELKTPVLHSKEE